MHYAAAISMCLITMFFTDASTHGAETAPAVVQLALELTDGSRISGEPIELKVVPLKIEFTKLDIPLELISQGEFTANRASFQIKLRNGDTITGSLELERVKVKTSYGVATVATGRIAKLVVREAPKP